MTVTCRIRFEVTSPQAMGGETQSVAALRRGERGRPPLVIEDLQRLQTMLLAAGTPGSAAAVAGQFELVDHLGQVDSAVEADPEAAVTGSTDRIAQAPYVAGLADRLSGYAHLEVGEHLVQGERFVYRIQLPVHPGQPSRTQPEWTVTVARFSEFPPDAPPMEVLGAADRRWEGSLVELANDLSPATPTSRLDSDEDRGRC